MSSLARRVALMVAILASMFVPAPASAAVVDEQALVVSIAQQQLGKPFRLGSNGPGRFDCSGLVYYIYERAGLEDRIGGKRYTADQFYKWGRQRGLLSRENPRVGDLALWTYRTSTRIEHIGVYIGDVVKTRFKRKRILTKVSPVAISALTIGVTRHKMHTISVPFFSYVHIGLGLRDDNPPPDPDPDPTPTPDPTPGPISTPDPNATPAPQTP